LNEILLRTEFLDTCTKDRHPRTEYESLFWSDDKLFILWEDMIHRIDISHRIVLHDEESITEPYIIARGLEASRIKS
jgi:hypothetical protein